MGKEVLQFKTDWDKHFENLMWVNADVFQGSSHLPKNYLEINSGLALKNFLDIEELDESPFWLIVYFDNWGNIILRWTFKHRFMIVLFSNFFPVSGVQYNSKA